ncbi:phage tail tape measure protein [Conchiformibius steedae]|uniref:phage tail tape measure protein n=1 Tax=Conchiformibius steedae TaxID=153493 RepID=UPI0026F33FDA|nr:phage tail tape measure protein [Conchiformibius steedae]
MSADTKIRAGLEIQANVKGTQQIHQLADSLEAAGVDASKLREHGLALAQTWQQLESRKALIDHFKSLQTAADGLADELKAAQEQSEKLKQAWQADKGNENAKMAYVRQAKAVSDLSKKQDELRQKLQHARTAMDEAGIAVKNLAKHEAQLAQESTAAQNKLSAFTREAEKLNKIAAAKRTLGLDIDDHARDEIKQLNQAFSDLKQNGNLTQKELARAAELHRQKLANLEGQLKQTGASFGEIAAEIGNLAGSATAIKAVTQEAIEFESAMAGVKKVTDANAQQLAKLSDKLKDMAGELGILPAELAKIATAGGQMGIAFDRLPEFTKMAAQMANAFGITSDQAGEAAAKISNVYQLSIDQMRELGDAINVLGNTTAAKEAEITEVLLRIGGNAKQFGLLKEEAAALSAALISLGKTPETAGTAINAMLTKLQTAQVQGKEFKDALNSIGLSADAMAAQIRANPQAALTGFLKQLEKVDQQSRAIVLAKLFGAEYSDDLALLTGSLKTYEKALATATDKGKNFGAMQKEASAALATTEGKMKQAKAELSAAAIELGNALLPVVQSAAAVVGNIADSVSAFTQQYPALSHLAVLLVSAKIAIGAYQAAMRMAGVEGSASILKTDLSMQKLRASIVSTAIAAKTLGKDMKASFSGNIDAISTQTGLVGKLGRGIGALAQNVGLLWVAWEAGTGIGKALRENVEWISDIGDGMGKIIAYADALFTDRTFEDVRKFYRTTKQEAREAEKAQREAAAASAKRAEAEKQAAEKQAAQIQNLQAKHRQLKQDYQAVVSSMEALKTAGKENTAMYRDLARQQIDLGVKVQATGEHLTKLNAQIGDIGPLSDSKKALEALGLTVEQVTTGISQDAQTALDDFGKAAAQFGNDTEQMQRIFNAALSKMGDSPEAIAALKQELEKVGKKAKLSADEIRKIADAAPETADKVSAAFEKIGVDVRAVTEGIGREAAQAFKDFEAASAAAKDAGINDSRLLAAGFEQMMGKLKSPAEFDAFRKQLEKSGDVAKLTQDQLERLNAAAQNGAAAAKTAYEKLAESVKKAGDSHAAEAAGQAAAAAMKRGEISAEQYAQVLEAVKQRTEELKQKSAEAGDKAAQAHAKAAAAAEESARKQDSRTESTKQSTAETDQNTAAIERNTDAVATQAATVDGYWGHIQDRWLELRTSGKQVGNMSEALLLSMGNVARQATGHWQIYVDKMWTAYDNAQAATRQLNAAADSGTDVMSRLAKAEAVAISHARDLDKTSLANLRAEIDKARQKMQQLADEAKQTREDLQASLDELNGDSDASARLAQQRKLKELGKKRDAAAQAGNQDAQTEYDRAIELQKQVYARQQQKKAEAEAQRQREAEERAEQERQREAERQRQEAERQRQQAEREAQRRQKRELPPPNVQVDVDSDEIIAQLHQRDKQVAEMAVQGFVAQLDNALQRSR